MNRYQRVFLTGATGFFGAHIAAELLRSGCPQVICLVRGGGVERVAQALRGYGLWEERWGDRVSAVAGDLEQPELGLGATFRRLANDVDAVIHNGANVNYVLGLRQLKAANVTATQDALRIAEAAKAPFLFVSTLRMFDHRLDRVPIREQDTIDIAAAAAIGYAHSKVQAERLVDAAAARGVRTAIFRPGMMCGDGRIGAPNPRDAVSLLVKACVAFGAAPTGPMQINLTSVRYAAEALVALGGDEQAMGGTWHLVHDDPTPLTRLFAALSNAGHPLQMLPYVHWVDRLRSAAERGEGAGALTPLLGYFTASFPEETTRRIFDSVQTRTALGHHHIEHPEIDAAFLSANVRGMATFGHLPQPQPLDTVEV